MTNATQYFKLALTEEREGSLCSALLLYLSSFCDSFNSGIREFPTGAIAKIRMLQISLGLSDVDLINLVHSYGPLTDLECRNLLTHSINGHLAGINSTLSGFVPMDAP